MRHALRFCTMCLAAALAAHAAHAQSSAHFRDAAGMLGLTVDLADQAPGLEISRPVTIDRPTAISLVLLNAIPHAHYSISVAVDEIPVGLLPLSKPPALALPPGGAVHLLYGRLLAELDSASDERDVRRTTRRIRSDVEQAYATGGDFLLDSIDARTVHRLADVAVLRPGQQLRLLVVRSNDGGVESARWSTTFTSASAGEWQIGLGFAFPIVVGALERYSARRDKSGDYTIRASPSDDRITVLPALFFNWSPRGERLDAWSLSWTGGIGFDLQNPVVLLGGALSYRQNLTVIAGVAAHHIDRLVPEYAVGDVVEERLTQDDLVTSRYSIDPFIAVSFRLLGASIFR